MGGRSPFCRLPRCCHRQSCRGRGTGTGRGWLESLHSAPAGHIRSAASTAGAFQPGLRTLEDHLPPHLLPPLLVQAAYTPNQRMRCKPHNHSSTLCIPPAAPNARPRAPPPQRCASCWQSRRGRGCCPRAPRSAAGCVGKPSTRVRFHSKGCGCGQLVPRRALKRCCRRRGPTPSCCAITEHTLLRLCLNRTHPHTHLLWRHLAGRCEAQRVQPLLLVVVANLHVARSAARSFRDAWHPAVQLPAHSPNTPSLQGCAGTHSQSPCLSAACRTCASPMKRVTWLPAPRSALM